MKKELQLKTKLKLSAIFLTLSFLGCKSTETYPDVPVIILDLKNVQCRYYKLIDKEEVKFDGPIAYHNLYEINEEGKTVPNSKCEGALGYLPRDFKKVQNWARDVQRK